MAELLSGLSFIEVESTNPIKLFKQWQDEVIDAGGLFFPTNSMCLATSTITGKVSNRNVFLKKFDDNGFIFITTAEGRKAQEIKENPFVAATFFWHYTKNTNRIARQVRVEGKAYALSVDQCQKFYDQEKPFCKIRAHLCHQGEEVDWKILKQQHDQLVDEVVNKKKILPMPEYYIGYQIVPERMDFYYAWDNHIGDRVVFSKTEDSWKFVHVAA